MYMYIMCVYHLYTDRSTSQRPAHSQYHNRQNATNKQIPATPPRFPLFFGSAEEGGKNGDGKGWHLVLHFEVRIHICMYMYMYLTSVDGSNVHATYRHTYMCMYKRKDISRAHINIFFKN